MTRQFWKKFGTSIQETFNTIVENPEYAVEQIATKTSKTDRTIENYLAKLKKEGVIVRKGANIYRYWEIKET